MTIAFQKLPGEPHLGVAFFWRLAIHTPRPATRIDHFIPELFYDYFLVETGAVHVRLVPGPHSDRLPDQSLKTLHTHPLTFVFTTPLVLYGARFTLRFAELCWEPRLSANRFIEESWVSPKPRKLSVFADQLTRHLRAHQTRRHPYPLLAPGLRECDELAHLSARHKRRLYQSTFGVSRQALQRLASIQAFLQQTCDFGDETPHIISHLDPDVFYDQAHLNHTFKRLTGFSPSEYFQANSILQDNLMAVSYNELPAEQTRLAS